jgi:hypothetical protein
MALDRSESWFLKKHHSGEIFGPVPFGKIQEWTHSAQVNAQDMLSTDQVIWTKAPMIPELEMDWLVVLGEGLLYGPTTAEALLEFEKASEITATTALIDCKTGETTTLGEAPFFAPVSRAKPLYGERAPADTLLSLVQWTSQPGSLRVNLQQRIRELENALLEERRKRVLAEESIVRLEGRIRELEERIRDYSGFRRS